MSASVHLGSRLPPTMHVCKPVHPLTVAFSHACLQACSSFGCCLQSCMFTSLFILWLLSLQDHLTGVLRPGLPERAFEDGELLLRQGEQGTFMMYILEGQVEVTVRLQIPRDGSNNARYACICRSPSPPTPLPLLPQNVHVVYILIHVRFFADQHKCDYLRLHSSQPDACMQLQCK